MCNRDTFSAYCLTGKERDTESGNDYFGARYYASSMGRMLSPDPSQLYFADPTNPQSLNLYSYGRNNPPINVDPTGLDCAKDNEDGTVSLNAGDCANENEDAANHEYYVNCDGCTANATGASLDSPTGTLTLTGHGGSALTDPSGNAIAIQGFADPDPAAAVSASHDLGYVDAPPQRVDGLVSTRRRAPDGSVHFRSHRSTERERGRERDDP